MSFGANRIAGVLAWVVVAMQAGFGALEMFAPQHVFHLVFASSYDTTSGSPIWVETGKLARNMGLYNWFLAVGLLLSQTGRLGGAPITQFFLLCVAVAGAFGLLSVGPQIAFGAQLGLGLLTFVLFLRRS
jgi:putative membrane protein